VVIPSFLEGFSVFFGGGSDLGGVVGPVFDTSAGAGVRDLVVAGEAAHLPEDGDAFVEVAFDLIWGERLEGDFARGASAFAACGEGHLIEKGRVRSL
jgi:hypothetical protein